MDHNHIIMATLRNVAKRYGLKCLLHEKPFSGINGSGKHVNYSIGNAELGTLLIPRNPARQCQVPGFLRGHDPRRA